MQSLLSCIICMISRQVYLKSHGGIVASILAYQVVQENHFGAFVMLLLSMETLKFDPPNPGDLGFADSLHKKHEIVPQRCLLAAV